MLATLQLFVDVFVIVLLPQFVVISTSPDTTSTAPSDDIPKMVPRTAAVVSHACILRLDPSHICVALVHMVPALSISCTWVMRLFSSGAIRVSTKIFVSLELSHRIDCEPSLK